MNPLLLFWRKLMRDLNLRPSTDERTYQLDEELSQSIQDIAALEKLSKDDVANRLLSNALEQRQKTRDVLKLWDKLSPREQTAVALCCLGYSSIETSERMGISSTTVKAHTLRAVHKFGLRSKAELLQALSEFDFSAWDR